MKKFIFFIPFFFLIFSVSAQTNLVSDINPGASGSNPVRLTNVGGNIFFTANDGRTGEELWFSDGTGLGTYRVRDIRPGSQGSNRSIFRPPRT